MTILVLEMDSHLCDKILKNNHNADRDRACGSFSPKFLKNFLWFLELLNSRLLLHHFKFAPPFLWLFRYQGRKVTWDDRIVSGNRVETDIFSSCECRGGHPKVHVSLQWSNISSILLGGERCWGGERCFSSGNEFYESGERVWLFPGRSCSGITDMAWRLHVGNGRCVSNIGLLKILDMGARKGTQLLNLQFCMTHSTEYSSWQELTCTEIRLQWFGIPKISGPECQLDFHMVMESLLWCPLS